MVIDRFEFCVSSNHKKLCVFARVPLVAWRANCDFRFLLDVEAVDSYCVKYATKDEKHTEAFSTMMRKIVTAARENDKSVQSCFSSLLIKTIGERDYTAQEVCGQLEQMPYVKYNRTVQKVNLGSIRALAQKKARRDDIDDDDDDDENGDAGNDEAAGSDDDDGGTTAAAENNVDRYSKRTDRRDLPLFNYISEFDNNDNPITDPAHYRTPFPVPMYHPHPAGQNYDQYCRNRLLLHTAWHGDPESCKGDYGSWYEALLAFLDQYRFRSSPEQEGSNQRYDPDGDDPVFDGSNLPAGHTHVRALFREFFSIGAAKTLKLKRKRTQKNNLRSPATRNLTQKLRRMNTNNASVATCMVRKTYCLQRAQISTCSTTMMMTSTTWTMTKVKLTGARTRAPSAIPFASWTVDPIELASGSRNNSGCHPCESTTREAMPMPSTAPLGQCRSAGRSSSGNSASRL